MKTKDPSVASIFLPGICTSHHYHLGLKPPIVVLFGIFAWQVIKESRCTCKEDTLERVTNRRSFFTFHTVTFCLMAIFLLFLFFGVPGCKLKFATKICYDQG